MRYKPQQQDENRRKILEATSRGFRRYGYEGIGVDGLAKAAGVTSGAIYSQFGSKEKAFVLALEAGMDEVIRGVPVFQKQHGRGWVEAFAKYYLGQTHRADLECGCAMATLTLDAVRAERPEIRRAYEAKMLQIRALVAGGLEGGTPEERDARAMAYISVLIGGVTICRAMENAALVEQMAGAVAMAAVAAAGPARLIDGELAAGGQGI